MAERRRPSRKRNSVAARARPAKAAKRPRAKAAKKPAAKTKRVAKKADPHAAVRRYRERMRAKGLRPVTIWAPDLRDAASRAALAREAAAILASAGGDPDWRPLLDGQDFPDWTV